MPSSHPRRTRFDTAVGLAAILAVPIAILAIIVTIVLDGPSDDAPTPTAPSGTPPPSVQAPPTTTAPPGQDEGREPEPTTTNPDTTLSDEAFLADLEAVNASLDMENGSASLGGDVLAHSLMYVCVDFCNERQGAIEFNLGKRYRTFEAVVGVADDVKDSSQVGVFEVYVDDVRRLRSQVQFGQPKRVSLTVTGALRLRLLATTPGVESPIQAGANIAGGVPNHLPNLVWGDAKVSG